MAAVKFYKVTSLPGTPVANAIYFVQNGDYAETYVTDSSGVAKGVGNTDMIEEIVTAQLSGFNNIQVVADISARDAMSLSGNALVLVTDATGDWTVASGAAMYFYRQSNDSFTKVTEYESMDVSLTWSAISGKPSSSAANIDAAVSASHTHSNITTLNKWGESGGLPAYDGAVITSADWTTNNW